MAGVGGFFLQGLAGGFAKGQQIQEMNWQRREKERIKKEEDALMETLTLTGKKFSSYYEDYNVSEEERLQAIATWSALSYEAKELLKSAYDGVMNYNKGQEEQTLATVKAYREQLEGLDFDISSISEISEMFRGQIKSPTGLKYFDAMDSAIRKRSEAQQQQPQIERFISPEGVIAKYPDAIPKHTAQGWIPEFKQPTEPQTELDKMEETKKWLDSAYATGNANYFNRVAKERGVPTTFDTYKQEYKKPEVGEEGTPAPTSTENIRDDILQAPTLNDAKRIYKNFDDKYDITALGIPDVDKFWGDERVRRLDSLKTSIENLLVDRGDKGKWLKPGTVTSAEVGMEIEDDEQEVAIAYRDLRDEYMRFRDMLEKMGIDVSQYPKLKPLSEIEKVGGWEGAVGWGVKGVGWGIKKGDYKSIYYGD